MLLPENIFFLQGAAEEFLYLKSRYPAEYKKLLEALVDLAAHGPPEETQYVPIQEPPFPNTVAYRFNVAGYTVVFESDKRVILRTESGLQIVRAMKVGGSSPQYTIWAITPAIG